MTYSADRSNANRYFKVICFVSLLARLWGKLNRPTHVQGVKTEQTCYCCKLMCRLLTHVTVSQNRTPVFCLVLYKST